MNIIKIETRGAVQPRARAFIYVMHDCRRHEFVIIFTFYNRHSIQIQPLKLLVICYIGENNLACKFRKKSTLLLCSTVQVDLLNLHRPFRQEIYSRHTSCQTNDINGDLWQLHLRTWQRRPDTIFQVRMIFFYLVCNFFGDM